MPRDAARIASSRVPRRHPESIEEVHEVLGSQVSGRAGCVGTTAQPARRGVKSRDTRFETRVDVDQRCSPRVVKVQGQVADRYMPGHRVEQVGDLPRVRDADRVAERDLVGAKVDEARRQFGHACRRHRPFERAAEARRQGRPDRQSRAPRLITDALRVRDRLVDGLVDVPLAERFGGGGEDRHFVHACLARAREALQVGHERGVADARPARDTGEDLGGIRHLRHPLRAHEGGHLDRRVAGVRQSVDQRDLVRRRHEGRFVLQPIAWTDLDDGDPLRERGTGHSSSRVTSRNNRS